MVQTSINRKNVVIALALVTVLSVFLGAGLVVFKYNPATSNQTNQPKNISLKIAAIPIKIIQGGNLYTEVNVTSIEKSENITLSCDTGTSGFNYTFEPSASGNSNFSRYLTIYVPPSTPLHKYSITLTAADANESQSAPINFSVVNGDAISPYVTVSGTAVTGNFAGFNATLNQAQFVDIQTGEKVSVGFQSIYSPEPTTSNGTYSAILQNEHIYHASVSVFFGLSGTFTFDCGNVYVYSPPGKSTMQIDYPYLIF